MFTQLVFQSLGAALVYAIGFFGTEALLCLTAEYGCQTRGDMAAVVVVIIGFILVTAITLGLYLAVLQRVAVREGVGATIRSRPSLMFLCSLGYGILIAVLLFGILGESRSFFMDHGFWIHAIVGSVCFGGYVVAIRRHSAVSV